MKKNIIKNKLKNILFKIKKIKISPFTVLNKSFIINCISLSVMCVIVLGCILINKSFTPNVTFANANYTGTNSSQELPIFKVKTDEKKIALTFNAAWENEDIPELLKKLENNNVKLTFFIVGDFAKQYPDSVKQISDAGHEIANHSYSHPHVANISIDEIIADMTKCDNLLKEITGKDINLYRAPYGEFNKNVVSASLKNNHQCVQWNIDSRDWRNLSPQQIEENILNNATPGSIVLFHTNKENTFDAIDNIIKRLKQNSFEICTVSQLLYKENYYIDSEGTQIKN